MTRVLPSPSDAVRVAEHAALDTARSHLDAARTLYDQGRWPQTAIEELGKALLLQKGDAEGELPSRKDLIKHETKAALGAVTTLVFNDEARR
jgi:hypothetical protein